MKDKTQHTPGPWQLTTIPFELRNTDSAAAIYGPQSIEGGACLIADISRSAGDDLATANAQLIAKAPELLKENEQLKQELKDSLANAGTNDRDADYFMKRFEEVKTLNAELLKACKMVIDEWHNKKSNFNRKEPSYLEPMRKAIAKAELNK